MDEADPPAILRSEVLKIIDVVLDSSISIDFLGESELLLETEVVRVLQKGLKRAEANLKEQKRILDEKVKAVGGFVQIWVRRSDGRPPPEGLEPEIRGKLGVLLGGSEQDSAFAAAGTGGSSKL